MVFHPQSCLHFIKKLTLAESDTQLNSDRSQAAKPSMINKASNAVSRSRRHYQHVYRLNQSIPSTPVISFFGVAQNEANASDAVRLTPDTVGHDSPTRPIILGSGVRALLPLVFLDILIW